MAQALIYATAQRARPRCLSEKVLEPLRAVNSPFGVSGMYDPLTWTEPALWRLPGCPRRHDLRAAPDVLENADAAHLSRDPHTVDVE